MNGVRVKHLVCWFCVAATFLAAAGIAAAASKPARYETPGNPKNAPSWTFANARTEHGRGPNLTDHKPVLISCRVKGAKVADGNVWWYRIAARPWDNRYYVSADDFYNNAHTEGSLHGTPFYDAKVALC